jgi:hypothetical protein
VKSSLTIHTNNCLKKYCTFSIVLVTFKIIRRFGSCICFRHQVKNGKDSDSVRPFDDRLCGLVVRVPGYRSKGSGLDSRRYQIFWEVVSLERGPLSLVSTLRSYLEEIVAAPGLENREHGSGNPLFWPRDTLYPQKLALTSPTSGGRLVGIVRLRTKTTEFTDCLLASTEVRCRIRKGKEPDRQKVSNFRIKNAWSHISTQPQVLMAW